ncbi:hypothetical protein EV652_13014 [Kribbella steppae]|uniref:Uncharacterized protein n=1 Tax=Kribbella steppae TaxID=2512223 RepID=A0A4R2GRB3_9ACTN|nr:hypothetical protein EV652_13014 [Kribbella steppae]
MPGRIDDYDDPNAPAGNSTVPSMNVVSKTITDTSASFAAPTTATGPYPAAPLSPAMW